MNLSELAELENDDPEMVPDIVAVDARLRVQGAVSVFSALFTRAAATVPLREKELVLNSSHALLSAHAETSTQVSYVTVSASDGDQAVFLPTDEVHVVVAGQALLPARKMLDILKMCPSPTVRIEVVGDTATIRSSQAQWSVKVPVGEELPIRIDAQDVELVSLEPGEVLTALSSVVKATNKSSARIGHRQVRLHNSTVLGSDGNRVHQMRIPSLPSNLEVTLPLRVVTSVVEALQRDPEAPVDFGYSSSTIVFRVGQDSIISQRLLVPYPEVDSVLLRSAFNNEFSLTLNRELLLSVVRRMRINADAETAAIRLLLTAAGKAADGVVWALAVRSKDRIGNASEEVLDCQWSGSGKVRELVFNHKHLTDILMAVETPTITLRVSENLKSDPTTIYVEDSTLGFTGVLHQMVSSW